MAGLSPACTQADASAMNESLVFRRALQCAAGTLIAAIALIAAMGAALDSGHFREPLIRYIASRVARPVTVEGSLEAHVLSFHPRLIAGQVTIGNPPWMPPGFIARIGELSLSIGLPGFGHPLDIEKLEMKAATLHLVRDSSGRSNWQTEPGKNLPMVRSLSMRDAHVELADALRHLTFEGAVSSYDVKKTGAGPPPLRLEGVGQLNGRPVTFEVDADPLAAASRARPYRFTYAESSSATRLTGSGFLSRPFDFDVLDATFDAAGADLKDLYHLTGVTLVNTGSYRLTGNLARRGSNTRFTDLALNSGQSDVRGTVSIETSDGRPSFDAELNSRALRMADIGAQTTGRDAKTPAEPPMLLSKEELNPATMRRGDGVVHFHAQRVEVGRVPLQDLSAKLTLDHGILVLSPLSAEVLGGRLTLRGRLDATTDNPAADIDLEIFGLQAGELFHDAAAEPPIEGLLRARVAVKGHGSSLHQVAASANGAATAVLSHATIRASLAKLAASDLRGLGLLLTKSAKETPVRCAVASFSAHDGTLAAQSLVIDTDPALIIGDGTIHMDSEALDLVLRGHPKGVRLVPSSTSMRVRGTLARPEIQPGVAQSAGAMVLGALLTPLTSVLTFVGHGATKDADCEALVQAASSMH